MKKITLLAAVIFCSAITANAQVSKGALFLGGSLGFGSEKTETTTGAVTTTDPERSDWNFSPQAGYFITNNIAAGIMLDFAGTTIKTAPTPTTTAERKINSLGFGVFGRYYAPINDKFYFWGQLGLMFGSGSDETTAGAVTINNGDKSMMDISLRPGFTFFPSTRYGLDFSVGGLGFGNTTTTIPAVAPATEPTEVKTSNFGLMWDMTAIRIGVHVFFGGGGGAQ